MEKVRMAQSAGVMEGALALELPRLVAVPDLADIYQAEFPYVWRTLRRLGLRGRDIEDGVQDVFVVVHRRLADFDPERPIRPWLFGIAYRIVIKGMRRVGTRAERLVGDVEAIGVDAPADEQIEERQRRALVLAALERLEPERRAVLVMHDMDGHGAPEIAQALEIPVNTVYSRLRLARKDFVAAIGRLRVRERAA